MAEDVYTVIVEEKEAAEGWKRVVAHAVQVSKIQLQLASNIAQTQAIEAESKMAEFLKKTAKSEAIGAGFHGGLTRPEEKFMETAASKSEPPAGYYNQIQGKVRKRDHPESSALEQASRAPEILDDAVMAISTIITV